MLPASPVGIEDDSRLAGAPVNEIEITPEMIEAGVVSLEACRGACADEHIVREVYTAMLATRRSRTLP